MESSTLAAAAMKKSEPIRIVLLNDQTLLRAGLRSLIDSWPDFKIVGDASKDDDAIALTAREKPDIVVLDLSLNADDSELDFLSQVLTAAGEGQIILLTDAQDPDTRLRAVRLGAKGIVSKNRAAEDLRRSIVKVHAGELWLDRSLTASLIKEFYGPHQSKTLDTEEARIASLTHREREVATIVCQGLKNRDIGERLFISETTVRHHLTSIFSKLQVSGRFEMVILLYKHKIAKPPA